jgi:hypothetical protein
VDSGFAKDVFNKKANEFVKYMFTEELRQQDHFGFIYIGDSPKMMPCTEIRLEPKGRNELAKQEVLDKLCEDEVILRFMNVRKRHNFRLSESLNTAIDW